MTNMMGDKCRGEGSCCWIRDIIEAKGRFQRRHRRTRQQHARDNKVKGQEGNAPWWAKKGTYFQLSNSPIIFLLLLIFLQSYSLNLHAQDSSQLAQKPRTDRETFYDASKQKVGDPVFKLDKDGGVADTSDMIAYMNASAKARSLKRFSGKEE